MPVFLDFGRGVPFGAVVWWAMPTLQGLSFFRVCFPAIPIFHYSIIPEIDNLLAISIPSAGVPPLDPGSHPAESDSGQRFDLSDPVTKIRGVVDDERSAVFGEDVVKKPVEK